MKKAIYAFSGDPITYGHLDIIKRATEVFDEVTVAIGINPEKEYMFSLNERTMMAEQSLKNIPGVVVVAFEGLLVDYAYEHNIPVIIKGLRNGKDFDYELILHQMSQSQQLDIDTFFLPAKQDLAHISSSSAKGLQLEQGLIHEYVPLYVKQCLEAKISGQYIIGVTGEIGSGKSYLCEYFLECGRQRNIEVHNIELDHIGHQILGNLSEPLYQKVRNEICEKFGSHIRNKDGAIDRKKLGDIVFNDMEKLAVLNQILSIPLLLRLRRDLYQKKGIIFFNAALIAESSMAHLCNNNVVLVTVNKETQKKRLYQRNLSNEQIEKRLMSQYNTEKKISTLQQKSEANGQGKLWIIDNSDSARTHDFDALFEEIVHTIDIYGELRFKALYKRLGIEKDFEVNYRALIRSFARKKRYYHTLQNTLENLTELSKLKKQLVQYDIAEAALWYCHAVQNTEAENSIELNARYAYNTFKNSGLDVNFCNQVAYYIRCTNHLNPDLRDDAVCLADIDLLVLGKSEEVFAEFESNLRREFYWMPENQYLHLRKEHYQRLLQRPAVFLSGYFKQYETQARKNLERFLGISG